MTSEAVTAHGEMICDGTSVILYLHGGRYVAGEQLIQEAAALIGSHLKAAVAAR